MYFNFNANNLKKSHISSGKPSVTTPFMAIKEVFGKSLSLTCTSDGSPPDTFTWMKDGKPIQKNIITTKVTYNRDVAVFKSTYSIVNFSESDVGVYTCKITNPMGSDFANIFVDTNYSKCN